MRVQTWVMVVVVIGVCRAQVSTVQVIRGNRRDDVYSKEENFTVTAAGGVIHSPRYPNSYPRNVLLSWKLLSPPGMRIHLDFDEHFCLEEADNGVCRYDFVEVEDQSETSTIIWGRWCGQKAPPSINSNTNTLRVTFKSDDYFVAKPGFKIYYSLLNDSPLPPSINNWEPVTKVMLQDNPTGKAEPEVAATEGVPLSVDDLDRSISGFDTVEQLLRFLNPDTWRQDLDRIFTQTHIHYISRAYHLTSRHSKVDLDRLHDDVKRYSCTPRNHSVNLREELRVTSATFFPRCLLVKRCGGNCGCGTSGWNNGCTCQASKAALKLHEVLRCAPDTSVRRRHWRPPVPCAIYEILLTHHEKCQCECPSQPPR